MKYKTPTFIGIGGRKSASTWLYECLKKHPNIFMISPKELHYFLSNNYYNKSREWYFEHLKGSLNYKAVGEMATSYIYHPETANRIFYELGEVKIIAIVRDPTDRTISHIKQMIREEKIAYPNNNIIDVSYLQQALNNSPQLERYSRYFEGLQAYKDIFGINKLRVYNQDDCEKKPRKLLEDLFLFLGVSNEYDFKLSSQKIGKNFSPKNKKLEKIRYQIFYQLKTKSPELLSIVRKSGLSSLYRKLNNDNSELKITKDAKDFLLSKFDDEWQIVKKEFVCDLNS